MNNSNKRNNVIKFPICNGKPPKRKKKKWKLIISILTLVTSIVAIIVTVWLYNISKKELKPALNISMQYYKEECYESAELDERGEYLNKILVEMGNTNVEAVNLTIEPFFNIILYNQNKKSLIKQLLPIKDIENNPPANFFFSVKNLNIKNGTICEIEFNIENCKNIKNILGIFSNPKDIDYSDFIKRAGEAVITSIDLEFYIIAEYKDVYGNNYTEIYLCQTGFKNFSNYLPGIVWEKDEMYDEEIIDSIIDWSIDYARLKIQYIENNEFNAKTSKIDSNDLFYNEFQKLYQISLLTPDSVFYVPNAGLDLDELITSQYIKKNLVFIFDEQNTKWSLLKD